MRYNTAMRLLLLAMACTQTPTETMRDYDFAPWQGEVSDAGTDRLCVEAADPEAAPDKVFIDCALEGDQLAPADVPATDELVVVAWNLERGSYPDEQVAVLRDIDADVLLISEADRGCARTDGLNVPWLVSEALGMNYVFAVEFVELPRPEPMGLTDDSCEHGNFIASRYPLGNVDAFRHAENKSWYDEGQRRLGGRIAITADVAVGEHIAHFTVVHFESDVSIIDIQVDQAAETAERALTRPFATVVGGDTNAAFYWHDLATGASNDGVTQAFFTQGFTDTHADLADRATVTEGFVLDLLLTTATTDAPGICAEHGCGGLSDHKAVWATLPLGN
jgi:endonuclease/exonuclease/phosphatase family metal-dependent hydrolase